ncbi:hypothetical protein HOF40_00735 [Candidatus Parcubacteria bacterium]|jgi:hypothetical protein|nr:hypothetical protein [Candidatus Parcubacteria bacterium]MBT3948596.1 hypothetical protein [Candidatus Parcubacteria bacterium]
MTKTLSQTTLDLIDQFLNLTFNGKKVSTPYFNNRRAGSRGALRVSVGKGSIEDIREELKILSLREKVDLRDLDEEIIKRFIVNHKIGIDCSGFVYYILDTELQAQNKGHLKKHLKFPHVKNPLRKLLTKLRPVENCSVKTLAHEMNSTKIELKNIQSGDMIMLMNTGPRKDYNHVMLVESVILNEVKDLSYHENSQQKEQEGEEIQLKRDSSSSLLRMTVTYVHSFQYPEDGKYNHGVRKETVVITDDSKSIVDQQWNCSEMNHYKDSAESISIHRLKALS